MSKSVDIPLSYWSVMYNGIVPTGKSDYSSSPEYVARIVYKTKIGDKRVEHIDRKVFTTRDDALNWIDSELEVGDVA